MKLISKTMFNWTWIQYFFRWCNVKGLNCYNSTLPSSRPNINHPLPLNPWKFWRKLSLNNAYEYCKISNLKQTASECTVDVNTAYTLQLNIIKLLTKYKIIGLHRSQEKKISEKLMLKCSTQGLLDGETDGQTDRRNDGMTDRVDRLLDLLSSLAKQVEIKTCIVWWPKMHYPPVTKGRSN